MIETILIVWIICGVFNYGYTFAYCQREWPSIATECEMGDRAFAVFMAIIGMACFIAIIITGTAKHGIMYRSQHEAK